MSSTAVRPRLAALLGYSIFGFSFLATKTAAASASLFLLLAFRFTAALICMTVLLCVRRPPFHPFRRGAWKILFLGLAQPVLYGVFETYGITLAGSAVAGSVISTASVFAYLLAVLFLGEKFKWSQFFFALGSIAGVFLLTFRGDAHGTSPLVGVLFVLAAALCAAAFSVLSKSAAKAFSAFERTYMMFLVSAVAFTAAAMVEAGKDFLPQVRLCLATPSFMLSILYLAVFSSVIAFLCINYAYTSLSVRATAAFNAMTAVVSVVAGIFVGEPLRALDFVGIAVILLCVYKVASV